MYLLYRREDTICKGQGRLEIIGYVFAGILLIGGVTFCTFLIGGLLSLEILSLTLTIGLITFSQFYYRKPETNISKNPSAAVYHRRVNRIFTLICGIITGIVWLWADTTFLIVAEMVNKSLLQWGAAGMMATFFIPMNLGAMSALVWMLILDKTIKLPTERSAFWVVEGLLLGGLGAGVSGVIYFMTFPWFFFFSLTGAFIVGGQAENTLSGAVPDMSRIIYAYKTGAYVGGIVGGMILGGGLGLLSTGIIREILGKKIWQWGAHNLWGVFTGLSTGVIYSLVFVLIYVIKPELVPLGRFLTENQVAKWVSIFCLPTNLPQAVDPVPLFYKSGDPSIPDVAVLYKDKETSERLFIMVINDVSKTSPVQMYGEYDAYDPAKSCENKVMLSNNLRACYVDQSSRPIHPNTKDEIVKGPPLVTYLSWQIQRDKLVTVYSLESSLPLAETKTIAASICNER